MVSIVKLCEVAELEGDYSNPGCFHRFCETTTAQHFNSDVSGVLLRKKPVAEEMVLAADVLWNRFASLRKSGAFCLPLMQCRSIALFIFGERLHQRLEQQAHAAGLVLAGRVDDL